MDHASEFVLTREPRPDDDQEARFEPEILNTLARVVDAEREVMLPAFEGRPVSAVDAARTLVAKFALHLANRGDMDLDTLCGKLHRAMQHILHFGGRLRSHFKLRPADARGHKRRLVVC